MSDTNPEKLKVEFTGSEDVPTIPVTGAWGGVSTDRSNIIAFLFVAHGTLPDAEYYDIEEKGVDLTQEPDTDAQANLTREVTGKLVMSLEVAGRLRDWLDRKIKEAKEAQAMADQLATQETSQDDTDAQ